MFQNTLQQISSAFPPKPTFTEANVKDLAGKVYVVTGANTGVGKELAQILYSKNAKVWVAARSEEKAAKAIDAIKEAVPESTGQLVYLRLDLADTNAVAKAADEFLKRETRLDVLFNNAGLMMPPRGTTSAQGYEIQFGVNNIGTFMFTKLISPLLVETAKTATPGTVRVVWVASSAAEAPVVPTGGIDIDDIPNRASKLPFVSYALSKAGNYLHAVEMAKRFKNQGVVSVPLNPGNLKSDLWRELSPVINWFLNTFFLHDTINGAYTELFAGLSPDISLENTGTWVGPFGRIMKVRDDLLLSVKSKEEGGHGTAREFWEWSEAEVEKYL